MNRRVLSACVAAGLLGIATAHANVSVRMESPVPEGADPHGTLPFAASELKLLTAPCSMDDPVEVVLGVDGSLVPFSFRIAREKQAITLVGHSPAETLAAVYTLLEQGGYRFEVTGPVAPAKLSWESVGPSRVVMPAITRRGVRQHINFNMDVSGWPLEEAREYIRNLARLRYNYMTFHSYPGHWTRDRIDNLSGGHGFLYSMTDRSPEKLVTGAFFYGSDFKIPKHPLIRSNIRFNKDYFCAPEFEAVLHTHPERGQKAQAWLRELMAEAKRCGMTIQFSTEPKRIDNAYNQKLAERILEDYPLIDYLEFISQESGDFKDAKDVEVNRKMAEEIILAEDDAALMAKYPTAKQQPPLSRQVRDYANNIRIIRHLQAQHWEEKNNVTLICGSYAVRSATVTLQMELAEKHLPDDQLLAIMPGHSSRYVNTAVQEAGIKPELLRRLLIHSWLEFDGYMMLQQQAASGLHGLARYIADKTGQPPYGIVGNHWRTAPNTLSFRYLSEMAFDPSLSPESYFRRTADELGIPDALRGEFVEAMTAIDELSDAQAIAGNIGFNLGWGISPAARTIGHVWWWGARPIEEARDRFKKVHEQLTACRAACETAHGGKILDQLLNGAASSVEHLRAVLELKPIADRYFDRALGKMREDLAPEDQAFILECANKADRHFQAYMKLLSGQVNDRSEEGMLLTYYWGPVVYAHNIRALYAGEGAFIQQNDASDVVPQPLTAGDEKRMGP